MNEWEQMCERQRKQQRDFGLDPETMDEVSKIDLAKDLALGLVEEAGELAQDASRYKRHLLEQPFDRNNIIDECADVMKYLISLAQLHSITNHELFDGFMRKSEVMDDRERARRLKLEVNTRLIISDLDGCIADLSSFQGRLASLQDGRPISSEVVGELERLKTEFYRGGGFRDVPPIAGAREALDQLRDDGWKIVIITARPTWQYKTLYADTIQWLKDHRIQFDLILFSKDKAEAIYDHIFPARPTYFIEDRSKHVLELVEIGVPVLMLDYPWNQNIQESSLMTRVKDWSAIMDIIASEQGRASEKGATA